MKVALLQGRSGDDLEDNIDWLEESLGKVSEADLVVLPEMWPFLVPDARGAERKGFAEHNSTRLIKLMEKLSSERDSCLVSGSFFLPAEVSGKVTNSSLVFYRGNEISRYHKRHLFDNRLPGGYSESETVVPGNEIATFSFKDWTIGQSICYDLRFPYHFAGLRQASADLVVCPSAFTWKTGQSHWETLVRARAIENQFYMLAVNQCGEGPTGVHCWGHSILVDPWGEVLLDLGDEPGYGVVEIDLNRVEDCRQKMPVWDHRCEGERK